MREDTVETHRLDPKKQTWGNWPDEANWPVGKAILWNGVEPITACGRLVRFVVLSPPDVTPSCRRCQEARHASTVSR